MKWDHKVVKDNGKWHLVARNGDAKAYVGPFGTRRSAEGFRRKLYLEAK
jgi:hypothetical protein